MTNSLEWIKANELLDGGFCLPCVISARASCGSIDLGVLVSWPMKTLYKATEILRKHRTLQYQKNSIADMVSFLDDIEQHTPSVAAMVISAHDQPIQAN